MRSDEKAQAVLDEEGAFLISEGNKFDYYKVKGSSHVYDVIYDKAKDSYHCCCDNVRLTPCYHIRVVMKLRE